MLSPPTKPTLLARPARYNIHDPDDPQGHDMEWADIEEENRHLELGYPANDPFLARDWDEIQAHIAPGLAMPSTSLNFDENLFPRKKRGIIRITKAARILDHAKSCSWRGQI